MKLQISVKNIKNFSHKSFIFFINFATITIIPMTTWREKKKKALNSVKQNIPNSMNILLDIVFLFSSTESVPPALYILSAHSKPRHRSTYHNIFVSCKLSHRDGMTQIYTLLLSECLFRVGLTRSMGP